MVPTRPLPTARWHRGPDPDPGELRRLYVTEKKTETEIARILSVSRARVAEAMITVGIERRTNRRVCPVDAGTLADLYTAPGTTVASLARHFGVARATTARWLAEAHLLPPDPTIDRASLVHLYEQGGLTVREVAERLGTTHARVERALAASGIPARSNHSKRPRGNRARVTDDRLVDLYVRKGMGLLEVAANLGVSTEYLTKRLGEAGLVKKPGSFTPRSEWDRDGLQRRAADLYGHGMSMKAVAEQLGVSVQTVRLALHAAQVPVRRGGVRPTVEDDRVLIDDLYADNQIRKVLTRHGVVIPDEWSVSGPFESLAPLPLSLPLVRTLYETVGLPTLHIALLLGVGVGSVKSALIAGNVDFRSPGIPAPWTTRRFRG